jgi:hypothetical protein
MLDVSLENPLERGWSDEVLRKEIHARLMCLNCVRVMTVSRQKKRSSTRWSRAPWLGQRITRGLRGRG